MNQKLTNQDYLEIIKLYYEDNISHIAKIYNIDSSYIYLLLKKYNMPTKVQVLKNNTSNIIKMYIDGCSASELGKIYNVSKKTILNLLHSNNVLMRDARLCHRKYTLDEKFFDNINTQEQAYILGLLWADGYNDGKGKISISLQERDVDILEKIKDILNTNIPLNYRNFSEYREGWQNQYRLYFYSKHMSKMLNDYGMHPNKSLDAKFPTCVSEELYPHFIRGYCDGDGHIGLKDFSIAGSKYLIPKIKEILDEKCNVNCIIYNGNGCLNLRINKLNYRKRILSYLYKDANLYLNRKYINYLEVMNI